MGHKLDNAKPKLLCLRDGTWSMTMEELVAIADSIFRPMTYIIKGAQSILAIIDSASADQKIAKQTKELVEKYSENSKTMAEFTLRDNSWIPVPGTLKLADSEPTQQGESDSHQKPDAQNENRIRTLEKAIKRMGDLMKIMDTRLKKLEGNTN